MQRLPDQNVVFAVTDTNKVVEVRYRGLLPDLFREGQGIVAEGVLVSPTQFKADSVLAKHDENYMPKEVADALKKQGVWQHGGEGRTGPRLNPRRPSPPRRVPSHDRDQA